VIPFVLLLTGVMIAPLWRLRDAFLRPPVWAAAALALIG